jgi:hypothetical protein
MNDKRRAQKLHKIGLNYISVFVGMSNFLGLKIRAALSNLAKFGFNCNFRSPKIQQVVEKLRNASKN